MSKITLVAAICLLAIAAGFGLYRYGGFAPPEAPKPLPPGLQFSGLDGKPHTLDEWHGKLLLVNFWATWCSPCLAEIPDLLKLEKQYGGRGFQIVGPAVDDPDQVRGMVAQLGIDYPVLVGSPDQLIGIMEKLGNAQGALPYSLLVGPDGLVVYRQLGAFSKGELAALIEGHLPGAAPAASNARNDVILPATASN
jgi:thiol-disulfide isomerase/thioredoxin